MIRRCLTASRASQSLVQLHLLPNLPSEVVVFILTVEICAKFKVLLLLKGSLWLIPSPYMNHDRQQDRNSGLLEVREQVE
jgi:hypothetical protein